MNLSHLHLKIFNRSQLILPEHVVRFKSLLIAFNILCQQILNSALLRLLLFKLLLLLMLRLLLLLLMLLLVAVVSPREVWMSCSPVGVVSMWVRVPIRIALASLKVGHIIDLFLLTKGIAYLAILRCMTSGA